MSTEKKSTQVVVIGAGPGGYAAAFRAADLGMEVTLVDPETNPGGVCLYRGCIPSKALLHVAKVVNEAKKAESFGVSFGEPQIDLEKLRNFKKSVVEKLTGGLGGLVKQRKITYLKGRALFLDSQTVEVKLSDNEETIQLQFNKAILATGSRPAFPEAWPVNSSRILQSSGALNLEFSEIPKKLLVVGGGYIGLELGSVYASLGVDVDVVEMTNGLLPGMDRDLIRPLQKKLKAKVSLETKVLHMKEISDGVEVMTENKNGKEINIYDYVLVSIGRKPNTAGLYLENTSVQLTEKGFVKVKGNRQTDDPSIYAIGDINGDPMLAHKASHEARVAVESIHGENVTFEPMAIPAVVFTDPEIAVCGLTEDQAKAQGREVKVVKFPWQASGRALSLDEPDGFTKILVDPEEDTILGVGIVGSGAGELIGEAVVAIEMGASVEDLAMCIHPHPTLSETIMEAAEVSLGTCTHIYRPKR